MERLIARYKGASALPPSGRVPALDGLRFIMVFSVSCFHLWQQSWLAPSFTLLGQHFSLDPWLRTGYLWVDGMLLLSGFLLFLPYARAREAGVQHRRGAPTCPLTECSTPGLRLLDQLAAPGPGR